MTNIVLNTDEKILFELRKLIGKSLVLDDIWRLLAIDLVYLIPVFLVINWFLNVKSREASIRGTIMGAFGWLVLTRLISLIWYRPRPVDSGIGIKEFVFHRPTYSFPSDHALFSFAVASGFYFGGQKKIGIVLYIVAFLISFSRVVVGVHFPLDVLAGALLGIGLSWLAWHFRGNFDPIFVQPIIAFAKWLHLA
jgi:undecaprenyl-diphosphatase